MSAKRPFTLAEIQSLPLETLYMIDFPDQMDEENINLIGKPFLYRGIQNGALIFEFKTETGSVTTLMIRPDQLSEQPKPRSYFPTEGDFQEDLRLYYVYPYQQDLGIMPEKIDFTEGGRSKRRRSRRRRSRRQRSKKRRSRRRKSR